MRMTFFPSQRHYFLLHSAFDLIYLLLVLFAEFKTFTVTYVHIILHRERLRIMNERRYVHTVHINNIVSTNNAT